MVSVADAPPDELGLNLTATAHELPGARLPQELLSLKLPASAPLSCTETVCAADPTFETDTIDGGLVDPSCCGAKDTVAGVTEMSGAAGDPLPPHATSAHSATAPAASAARRIFNLPEPVAVWTV